MNIIKTITLKSAGSCAIVLRIIFDICFNIFGKLVLNFLYRLYNLFFVCKSFVNIYSELISGFRTSSIIDTFSDEICIKNEVLSFKKIPHHMTFILGDEVPVYSDLVKIIKWSIIAGIPHISFYDHHNDLNSQVLFDYFCKLAKEHISLVKWGKSFSEDHKQSSKLLINGYSWRPMVTVHIYGRNDWTDEVVNSFSKLKLSDCDVSIKLLDTVLRERFIAPDPDLAVVCGNTLSFFGFPCWHLRITQIQKIPSHHNISSRTFLETLQEYCKCEQRYGK